MIKEIREHHGLTQEMLARLMGVNVDTVRKWEYSLRNPSQNNVQKLKDLELWIDPKGSQNEK